MSILILFCGILIIVFSKLIVYVIYGEEFENSAIALSILMVGVILKTPMPFLSNYFKSSNKPEYLVWISLITLPLNIIGGLILIPKMGIIGAAIVSSITYSLFSFMLVYRFLTFTKTSLSNLFVLNRKDIEYIKSKLKP